LWFIGLQPDCAFVFIAIKYRWLTLRDFMIILGLSYFKRAISNQIRKKITTYRPISYHQQLTAPYIDIWFGVFLKPFLNLS